MDEYLSSDYRARFCRSDPSRNCNIAMRDSYSCLPPKFAISRPSTMVVQRPLKRKHERVTNFMPSYVESCLVQLCRGERWMEAVHRCRYYAEEACLVPIPNHLVPTVTQSIHGGDNYPSPLFRETALGIVCASKYIGTEEGKLAILALVYTNPGQVGASEYISGHTPIRNAILNDRCTVEVFRILAEATSSYRGGDFVLHQKDRNGFSPIDHLVTSVQLGSSLESIAMLKEFLRIKQSFSADIPSYLEDHPSPLIRLLTMGNAFDSSPTAADAYTFSWEEQPKELSNDDSRLQRVLQATRLLLDDDPHLLSRCSKVTNCTPLHVALRNYGNFALLIEELLERDLDGSMIRARNAYGDLPIHVACSVGAPMEVLGLVIEKTARVDTANRNTMAFDTNALVMSENKSGYTPVDLAWICHIEPGNGLYMARPFCPSEATGVGQQCFKQDQYYRDLLKESVDQVTELQDSTSEGDNTKCVAERRKEEAETVFGDLLDRISLLIRAASAFAESNLGTNDDRSAKLVESCKLGTPYSPSLPLSLLELFLWLRPEEIMERDSQEFLPIHHALRYCKTTFSRDESPATPLSLNAIHDWKSFVFQILDKSSEQCRVKSREGRLPLHYALDHSAVASASTASTLSDDISRMESALQLSRHAIVEKLIDLYPGSVDQKDPVTGLYPFMMASADKSLSINTVFCLFRRSPSCCPT